MGRLIPSTTSPNLYARAATPTSSAQFPATSPAQFPASSFAQFPSSSSTRLSNPNPWNPYRISSRGIGRGRDSYGERLASPKEVKVKLLHLEEDAWARYRVTNERFAKECSR